MGLEGKIVFASGKAGDYDIWSLDLSTEQVAQLTTGEHWNDQPRWSPDGTSIVFVSNRAAGIPELWLMDANGANQRPLTSSKRYHNHPAWSPDGGRIVCAANYENPEEIELWAIDVSGENKPELLVQSEGLETTPSWSPDGSRILFTSAKSGNQDVWEYDLGSGESRQMTDHQAMDFAPAYSPDGRYIAFISTRESQGPQSKSDGDIWIVPADRSSQPRQLTSNRGTDRYVCWSPDGKYLAYCAACVRGNTGRIQVIDLEEQKVLKLDYDRSELEAEIKAEVKDFGLFTRMMPDFIQKKFVDPRYFGAERFPDWVA